MNTLGMLRVVAKAAIVLVMLGSLGMALLADEFGPWVFGVFPAVVILATLTVAISRSMRLRAAMRLADEDLDAPIARSASIDRS